MNLGDVLAQLREERDRLDAAISHLESLEHGRHPSPGRPRYCVTKEPTRGTKHRHRPSEPTSRES